MSLDKKIKFINQIGQGATGQVFLVKYQGQKLALKYLGLDPQKIVSDFHAHTLARKQKISKAEAKSKLLAQKKELLLTGFQFEAKVLKKLKHQNIAQFIDYGFNKENQKYFLLFEFVKGKDIFSATRNLSLAKKEDLFVQILRGLHYLHHQSVLHFDLKKENILVAQGSSKDLVAKIIDFGLANFHQRAEYQNASQSPGSPPYMAPEIWLGKTKDKQTDLYALGIIFYACLTGQLPWKVAQAASYRNLHLKAEIPLPSQVNPKLPKYWDTIILRLTAKEKEKRYPDAGFVIRELSLLSKKNHTIETHQTQKAYIEQLGELIGRSQEMDFFEKEISTFKESANNEPKLWIIKGSIGVGKSRFLDELSFRTKMDDQVEVVRFDSLNRAHFLKPTFCFVDQNITRDKIRQALLNHANQPLGLVYVEPDLHFEWSIGISVVLKNFNYEDVADYLTQLLKTRPLKSLTDFFWRHSQGNPKLLNFIARALIEKGFLVDQQGPMMAEILEDFDLELLKIGSSQLASKADQFAFAVLKNAKLDDHQWQLVRMLAIIGHPVKKRDFISLFCGMEDLTDCLVNLEQKQVIHFDEDEKIGLFHFAYSQAILSQMSLDEQKEYHLSYATFLQKKLADDDLITSHFLWHQACWMRGVKGRDLLYRAADLWRQQGNLAQVIDCYLKALSFFKRDQKLLQYFQIVLELAKSYFEAGQLNQAIDWVRQAIQSLRPTKDFNVDKLLWNFNDLALKIYMRQTQFKAAEECLQFNQKELKNFLECPRNQALMLISQNRVAQIEMLKGNYAKAKKLFLATRLEVLGLDPHQREMVKNNDLEDVYFREGQYETAANLYQSKLAHARDAIEKSRCLYSLIQIDLVNNEVSDAYQRSLEFLELAKKTQDIPALFRAYSCLAHIYFVHHQDYPKAIEAWQHSLKLAQKMGDPSSSATIAANVARAYNKLNKSEDARHYLLFALANLDESPMSGKQKNKERIMFKLEMSEINRKEQNLKASEQILKEVDTLISKNKTLTEVSFWVNLEKIQFFHQMQQRTHMQNSIDQAKKTASMPNQKAELEKILNQVQSV